MSYTTAQFLLVKSLIRQLDILLTSDRAAAPRLSGPVLVICIFGQAYWVVFSSSLSFGRFFLFLLAMIGAGTVISELDDFELT